MADERPQNVYDEPEFFRGYSEMERFKAAWGGAMEHAPFTELMGDVAGRRILDLGCGGGQLALHLAEAGAASVTAIDTSERMLEVARTARAHPRIAYRRLAMEEAEFDAGSFDLAVSSLALHYVEDYAGLVRRIATWLVAGGALVFSTEHPIYTARASADGWVAVAEGQPAAWAVDRYADEGARVHEWFVPGVRRYHRTLATLVNGLVDAGLIVDRLVEPVPGDDRRSATWYAEERRRPMFLLARARKA